MIITVVGGMNLDLLGVPEGPLLSRDSTPGKITLRPGGVGRNIAARLIALGARAQLITALGNDERARMLHAMCQESGIDLSLSLPTDRPAPCYLCIHDERGDMALAVNDMSAMERLTPETLMPRMENINRSEGCVLDANLPPDTLLFIAKNAAVSLILDPVSCAKAPRVKAVLPYLDAIKPNRLEAEAMTGERNVELAAEALLGAGVKNVFVSLGAEGLYYANQQEKGYMAARPLPAIPLTGAGDALCGGILQGLLEGKTTAECASLGVRFAAEKLQAGL